MSMQSSVQIKRIKRSSFPIANPMKCSHQRDCGCPDCEKNHAEVIFSPYAYELENGGFIVLDGFGIMNTY
jgi:hypothetical protein